VRRVRRMRRMRRMRRVAVDLEVEPERAPPSRLIAPVVPDARLDDGEAPSEVCPAGNAAQAVENSGRSVGRWRFLRLDGREAGRRRVARGPGRLTLDRNTLSRAAPNGFGQCRGVEGEQEDQKVLHHFSRLRNHTDGKPLRCRKRSSRSALVAGLTRWQQQSFTISISPFRRMIVVICPSPFFSPSATQ
jgi:hypothetical protein